MTKVGPWMLLINGIHGSFVPGTLFFLLCQILISAENSSHYSMWDQFYYLAHGQGQQRRGGSILDLGWTQIWVHISFFYIEASEIRSGDLWAFDKFPSALISCRFFSPLEFKGCLLQSCTALLIYGCLWGCRSSNFNSDRALCLNSRTNQRAPRSRKPPLPKPSQSSRVWSLICANKPNNPQEKLN